MGLFGFLKSAAINDGVAACAATPGAVLVDVRERDEYAEGHIPNSINLPLSDIQTAKKVFPDPGTSLFVYCLTGNRSSSAVSALKKLGYTDVTNIGGIRSYHGRTTKQ